MAKSKPRSSKRRTKGQPRLPADQAPPPAVGAPTARAKAADVLRLAKAGRTRDTIAADLGIGVASMYRILAEARATGAIAA